MKNSKNSLNLVNCAMGRDPADLVIRNGIWTCVQTGEFIPNTDIAIKDEHIAYIGADASHTIGPNTKVIEAKGQYLVPGLMDGHMHVESGMLTVTEFVRAVAPHGTTGMFIDPHEIANVLGLRGVKLMHDEALDQPIHVFVQVPSCVPSAPGFETPGAVLGPQEIDEAFTWPGIIGLGEMMNFPGVIDGDRAAHAILEEAENHSKVIGGHYAAPNTGLPFHGYVAGGAADDHEGTTKEGAIERARQGVRVMMRYGSAWHDVELQSKAITEAGLNPRYFILCTDDSHSATLIEDGHMDRVIRHAVSQGVQPMTAIQMATINTAEHFGLSRMMGLLAPGRFADVLIVPDIKDFHADTVIAKGRVIAKQGKLIISRDKRTYPDWAKNTIKLPRKKTAKDFRLSWEGNGSEIEANVIGILENQAPNKHLRMKVHVENGEVKADPAKDIAKIALVERHHNSGKVFVSLINGMKLKPGCALGSTVAHDCHQMIIVGSDDEMMAMAANELAAMGGGQIAVKDGKVVGKVVLPVAGLMSDQPAEVVAAEAATVLEGFRQCGCDLNNANMQLSLMALVVIPELRISDMGLLDVLSRKFISVLEG